MSRAFTASSSVLIYLMFCALREGICGRNCFKVGSCVQWIRLSNIISLHSAVVGRGKKKRESNVFLKIYRGPACNCYVTLKQIFSLAQKDVQLHTLYLEEQRQACDQRGH